MVKRTTDGVRSARGLTVSIATKPKQKNIKLANIARTAIKIWRNFLELDSVKLDNKLINSLMNQLSVTQINKTRQA